MSRTPFSKILIANRSEIACRIARTARALGYRTVSVFSDADADALHTTVTDEAIHIGGAAPSDSYLNTSRLVEAARRTGADAVHPGYGFLSENPAFASACREAGLVFIGPPPESIAAMGDKGIAKRLMREAGVPCIPGYEGESQDDEVLLKETQRIGFPVMIKAAAGGGGRGIRCVRDAGEFAAALKSARSEAAGAFGDSRVILEKAIISPRHVEVQVFADRHGTVIHLGERDCSVQRRHQKVIEEAPSPAVSPALREEMGRAAVRAAAAIGYEGAGTIEYMLDQDGRYYFMEMNTRLQVEHPVTEAITGLDLVELQLRIAAGDPLPLAQSDVRWSGHAIEVRLCSEDPAKGFAPQSGRMHLWSPAPSVRVDHALRSGAIVPSNYDSMIAKVIASGATREDARRRLIHALGEFVALGPPTNQDFLERCLAHPMFTAGAATTDFVDREIEQLQGREAVIASDEVAAVAALLLQLSEGVELRPPSPTGMVPRLPVAVRFELDGRPVTVEMQATTAGSYRVVHRDATIALELHSVSGPHSIIEFGGHRVRVTHARAEDELLFLMGGHVYRVRDRRLAAAARDDQGHDGKIRASMTGRIVAIHVELGALVEEGKPIFTIEAMKMEHTHVAPVAGVVAALLGSVDQQVTAHRVVAEIRPNPVTRTRGSNEGAS